jgi:D-alanine-D-alanine ligase
MIKEKLKEINYSIEMLDQIIDMLSLGLRIGVVYGGDKSRDGSVIKKTHNPRPWKSYKVVAEDIAESLEEIGFRHVYVIPDDMTFIESIKKNGIHLVWLNSGGVQGYCPLCHTPAMLEMLGIPYVGHNPLNAAKLDDKYAFKLECQGCGISTAPFMNWNSQRGRFNPRINRIFHENFDGYTGPFVVKPVSGRASIFVEVVDTIDELPDTVEAVYKNTLNTVLIEKYVGGREFCIAVCGNVVYDNGNYIQQKKPFAFSPVERVLEEGERIFTSMDKKAITANRAKLLNGEENAPLIQKLKELAQNVYLDLTLDSLIRLDVRADDEGNLFVLEANPKPDLKKPEESVTNLICIGLREHDLEYNDLIRLILANRIHELLTHKKSLIGEIIELLT